MRESFALHRYIGGRAGTIDFDAAAVHIDPPLFAEPLIVPLPDVRGVALLDALHWTDLLEGDVLKQPQRTVGARLLHANFAMVFRTPQPCPPPAKGPTLWRCDGSLWGLSLRVERAPLLVTMLGDLGVAYIDDIGAIVEELRTQQS